MSAGHQNVGHPIDVATGVQYTASHDVEVGGIFPLVFRRFYSTALLDRESSVLGQGWTHSAEASLNRDLNGYIFEGHDGERLVFDDPDDAFTQGKRDSLLNLGEAMELRREGKHLSVHHWHRADEPVIRYIFEPTEADRMRLLGRELPSGHGLVMRYDRLGRLETVSQKTERRCLYFSYDERGLLTLLELGFASRGPGLLVARYEHDAKRRLVKATNALGTSQRYQYDDAGRIISETGRSGGVYRFRYDAEGRCIESAGENGYRACRLVFDSRARITRVTNSVGHETIYRYNETGQVEEVISPNGAVRANRYDEYGRVVAEIGPIGDTTSYSYDDAGNLCRITYPNGGVRNTIFDDTHQPIEVTEPDGASWKMRYERGALIEKVNPQGLLTRYLRNANNDLVGVRTPAGNQITIASNEDHTEESVSDTLGLISKRRLDLLTNPIEIRNATGVLRRLVYDSLGSLVESIRPDGSRVQFSYDSEGDPVRIVDSTGAERTWHYSPYGDLVDETDPLGRTHHYDYDSEGRAIEIRRPAGQRAIFTYDAVGNVVKTEHFDGSIERSAFDLASRMVRWHRPGGGTLELTRDVAGNVLEIKIGERTVRSVKYTLTGEPTEIRTSDATLQFEYAPGGLITAEVQGGRRVEYGYHRQTGRLARRSWVGSKAGPLLLDFDARGRLSSLRTEGGAEQSFSYCADDLTLKRRLGAVVEEHRYDMSGRLRYQTIAGVASRQYTYDTEGVLLDVVDSLRGRRTFEYDAAEQLVRSNHRAIGEHVYEYDAFGNLARRDQDMLTYRAGDRLNTAGAVRLERDADGNITEKVDTDGSVSRYRWDAIGQLVAIEHPDGVRTTFGYDGLGRRVFKEHDGARTNYFWAANDLLAEQRDDHLTEYAIFAARPYAIWENGQVRHAVCSPQGVVHELIDQEGHVVWKGEYDDWGALVRESGSTSCSIRLPGQFSDAETGLHYNRFRYYAPAWGQYISPDPIGLFGGANRFRYAPNAINWEDPLGLVCNKSDCPDLVSGGQVAGGAKKGELQRLASEIREGGDHPASRNQRVIAVGRDKSGNLFAGSSNGFDKGQRAAAERLGIQTVVSKRGAHAEENLIREVPGLTAVGTSRRAPCGPAEHNCAQQLASRGIVVDNE